MLKWITRLASLVSISSQSHELGQSGIKYKTKNLAVSVAKSALISSTYWSRFGLSNVKPLIRDDIFLIAWILSKDNLDPPQFPGRDDSTAFSPLFLFL